MRTKKLFSLLLAVLMLCSLSVSAFAAETAQASVPVVLTVVNSVSPISVSVPACLPVTVLDGYVVTASNAVIENRAQSGAVQVVAVDVQPGAFAIGDFENFGSEAGKIAFSINGCKTVKEGKLTLADGAFPVIDAGKNLRIAYTAKVTNRKGGESERRDADLHHRARNRQFVKEGGTAMKTRKLTALLLALCMLLSLSISAFAADDAVASGTIPDSKITWELDDKGWLTISGSGDCSAFTSKDDQPWAEYRSQITQVWFDGMESLAISDLAYWFEDCTNLTTAEIPSTTPVIGRHAFYNCPLLTKLSIYYGEHTLDSIGENAFWRETDSGDTLYIGYLIGYPKSSVPFHTYDWAASNRSERYFYDLYGVYQNADAGSAATSGIKKAPGISVQSTGTIIGNCPSCGKYSFQGTYVEVAHSSRGHANYNECNNCHYVQYLGTYTTKSHGAGGYGSGTCPDCGSHTWILQNVQDATCTSNGYRSYSCACGQTKSETIYSSGHSYNYGS